MDNPGESRQSRRAVRRGADHNWRSTLCWRIPTVYIAQARIYRSERGCKTRIWGLLSHSQGGTVLTTGDTRKIGSASSSPAGESDLCLNLKPGLSNAPVG